MNKLVNQWDIRRRKAVLQKVIHKYFNRQTIKDWAIALTLCWTAAYLFYKSILAIEVFTGAAIFVVNLQIQSRVKKRKWELTLQFRDGIQSLSNALGAGYSIENAFTEAVRDLRLLYEEDADIVKEFQGICQQIHLNRNVEDLLMEFGSRSEVEDIISFAEVVMTAKRTGGDLIRIMKTTSSNISDKIDIQREISTLIAAKKMEGYIMCVIPSGIIVYLNVSMPGFLAPMYETLIGRIIMTIGLGFYLLAVLLLQKIVDIKV